MFCHIVSHNVTLHSSGHFVLTPHYAEHARTVQENDEKENGVLASF